VSTLTSIVGCETFVGPHPRFRAAMAQNGRSASGCFCFAAVDVRMIRGVRFQRLRMGVLSIPQAHRKRRRPRRGGAARTRRGDQTWIAAFTLSDVNGTERRRVPMAS